MSKGTVCVSGVTGFIGSRIVQDLLEKGYKVHATARSISDPTRLAHITSLPRAESSFVAFEADLTTPGSFDAALAGCDYAIHCASPYFMNAGKDAQSQMIDPAVKGTVGFMESCLKAGSIKRVVVTSSVAAIADEGSHGVALTEETWNTASSLKRMPYYYSKSLAEKAAWDFVERNPSLNLVVINPFLVVGPSLVKSLNESPKLLQGIANGSAFPGILDFEWTMVDVRDVSAAHIAAIEVESAEGRYICANSHHPMHMREVVEVMQEMGFAPRAMDLTGSLFSKMVKLVAQVMPGDEGYYTRQQLSNPIIVCNEKIIKDLGISFRDSRQSLKDTLEDMIKWGHLRDPKA